MTRIPETLQSIRILRRAGLVPIPRFDEGIRALLYVNGWQVGQYINNVGPQHSFPVPTGVLNPHGTNTIAIAVWNTDASTGGLGQVKLVTYGSYASSLHVNMNESPGYDPRRYATPTNELTPNPTRVNASTTITNTGTRTFLIS
ncbi:beta galactosidase jelly roll domain-containing protein, partial [Kibdelosporangium lantanae]